MTYSRSSTYPMNRSVPANRLLSMKLMVLLLGITVSYGMILLIPDSWGGILAMTFMVVLGLGLSKMDPLHPYTWFAVPFYLYSISYPTVVKLTGVAPSASLDTTLLLQWMALVTVMIVVGVPRKKNLKFNIKPLYHMNIVAWPIYLASLLISSASIIYIYQSGLSTKKQISLDNSIYTELASFFSILIVSYTLLVAHSLLIKKRLPWKLMAFTAGFMFLTLLINGERDPFLRVVLSSVCLVHYLHMRLSMKALLAGGIVLVLLTAQMAQLKNSAVASDRIFNRHESMLVNVFNSEFSSASSNLRILLEEQDRSWSYFYGETYVWDIKRTLLIERMNATAWFNQTYYSRSFQRGGGYGFTLVGEGYINYGAPGVVFLFIAVGLLLKFLYIRSTRHVIWFIIYVLSIPVIIYSIRGDLSVLMSYFTKHILLSLGIIFILKSMLSYRRDVRQPLPSYRRSEA